jgi:hypothetical protein
MSSEHPPPPDPVQPMICHLRIGGHLGPGWSDCFEGLIITLEDNGQTVLSGPVVDQAALHGVLRKVRDLGIPLALGRVHQSQPGRDIRGNQCSLIHGDQISATGRRNMKAIVHTRYGSPDVLQLQEVEKPVPKDDEVVVQVHAASVNTLDWHRLRGQPFPVRAGGGLRTPKDPRLGVDLAGRVEAVNGYHPLAAYLRTLRPTGRYVLVGASTQVFWALFQAVLLGAMISRIGSKKVGGFVANPSQQHLAFLTELLEASKVVPVIERRYTLGETSEAMRNLEEGLARGKLVITV